MSREPQRYDVPACCEHAGRLAQWMPKGVKQHQYDEAYKRYLHSREASDPDSHPPTCGPEREGWTTYFESGGPGMHSEYVNISHCAFCGAKLDANTPLRGMSESWEKAQRRAKFEKEQAGK